MTQEQNNSQREYEFTAEIQQLLNILVHSLYSQREIFLRELISNASDALDKIRFHMLTDDDVVGKDLELKINISVDKDNGILTIKDTGVGMTQEEIVKNIGTIAHSGSKTFLQALEKSKGDVNLIGQFGVGFYSVFMVAEKVTLKTRSFQKDSKGLSWTSDGTGKYTIEEIDKEERGTEISLSLREEAKQYLEDWQLKDIIRKYSDFVAYPIFLVEEKVNTLSAIWTKSPSTVKEEEYEEFYKYLTHMQDKPLAHMHLSYDAPIQFYSLMYIPREIPWDIRYQAPENWKSLNLYAKHVFVKADCEELLPQYLRFVRGVVDSDDIPLNISRETLQENTIISKISKNLVKKVLDKLAEMANDASEDYKLFWNNFGKFIKQGYRGDYDNREKIADLVRFNSSKCEKDDELISLQQYIERMRPNQKEIYYLSGEDRDVIERSPHLEIFRRKDVEVLYLTDPLDDFLFEDFREYKEHKFVSAEKEEIGLSEIEDTESEDSAQDRVEITEKSFNDLVGFFKSTLKDQVTDVKESKRLSDSPCCLVTGKDSMGSGMEKLMKMMDEKYQVSKKIMELNRSHPLISQMAKTYEDNPREPILALYCQQLFDNCLLLNGAPVDPKPMVSRIQDMMQLYIKSVSEDPQESPEAAKEVASSDSEATSSQTDSQAETGESDQTNQDSA